MLDRPAPTEGTGGSSGKILHPRSPLIMGGGRRTLNQVYVAVLGNLPRLCCPGPGGTSMNDAHGGPVAMTSTKHSRRSPSARFHAVWVTGEIDIATAPRLRRALERAAPDSSGRVIVDLSEVTFMDCSGLGPLLEAEARLGGQLSLRGVPAEVTALLHLAGLGARFGIADDAAAVGERAVGALVGSKRSGGALSGVLKLEEKVANQRARVTDRARIDQAKGLLMASHGCDAEQAWQMLFRASRAQGVQVHDLAEALTEAAAGRDTDQSSAAMRAAVLAVMAPGGDIDRDPRPANASAPAVHPVLPSGREAAEGA